MVGERRHAGWALVVLAAGCGTVRESASPYTQAVEKRGVAIALSPAALRVRVRALARSYAGLVESTSDQILAEAPEPSVRRQALLWKADTIPAMDGILFNPDPLAGLIDAWTFTEQIRGDFRSGPAGVALGPWRAQALQATDHFRRRILDVAHALVDAARVQKASRFVKGFAVAHPIRRSNFARDSVLPHLAGATAQADLGPLAAVGHVLTASLDDLTNQLALYSEQLPAVARWQADLFLEGQLHNPQYAPALAQVNRLARSANQVAQVAAESPELIARERREAFRFMDAQRVATFQEIDRQRRETLADLSAQGAAVARALHAERVGALEQIGAIGRTLVVEAGDQAARVVDHIFRRLVQLVLVTVAAIFLAVVLGIAVLRRRHRPHPPWTRRRVAVG